MKEPPTAQTGLALPLKLIGSVCIVDANDERICTLNQSQPDRKLIGQQLVRLVNAHTELVEALRDWQGVAALLADAIRHLDLKAPNEVNQINAVIAGQAALKQYDALAKSTGQTQV